jgi:hypothetical protein
MAALLLDDRSSPPLRSLIGGLLTRATHADFAVANVRLGAIDLAHAEIASVAECRLLLDRLDVNMLTDTMDVAGTDIPMIRRLEVLRDFAGSGRLQLRAASAMRWSPDFSILQGLPVSRFTPGGAVCLIGAHYFSSPVVPHGASFTCALTTDEAVRLSAARFAELWEDGHDVLPVIRDLLQEILGALAIR